MNIETKSLQNSGSFLFLLVLITIIFCFATGGSLPSWRLPSHRAASSKGFLNSSRCDFQHQSEHIRPQKTCLLVLVLIAAILEISSKICAKETSTIQSMVIRSGSANVTPPWRCLWTRCKLVTIVILCVCVFSCFVCVCFDYQWSRLSSSVCVFWIKSCASMVSCVQSLPPSIISATWWSNLIITITLIRYVMCFSLILLSVDLSSPHVKNKMSKREFIRNTRGAVGAEGDKSLIVGYKLLFPLQWVEGWRKTSTEAFTTTFSCEAI